MISRDEHAKLLQDVDARAKAQALDYCDAGCFELARECTNLMGRILASSRRPGLTLKNKLDIQAAARELDNARRLLLSVNEAPPVTP
jgi:hypothetical protein